MSALLSVQAIRSEIVIECWLAFTNGILKLSLRFHVVESSAARKMGLLFWETPWPASYGDLPRFH